MEQQLTQEELEQVMQDIEYMLEIMEQIYKKNLKFFKKKHKDIYKLVIKEAKKIAKDNSKTKYAIELNQLGAIDIIDKKTGKFLYQRDPWIFGDEIANTLKDYKSIAFVNTGLGTQITSAIKFNKPKKVLICEKEIQLFRTSLYVVDYTELNELTKLSFSIGEDKCKNKKYDKTYKLDL